MTSGQRERGRGTAKGEERTQKINRGRNKLGAPPLETTEPRNPEVDGELHTLKGLIDKLTATNLIIIIIEVVVNNSSSLK